MRDTLTSRPKTAHLATQESQLPLDSGKASTDGGGRQRRPSLNGDLPDQAESTVFAPLNIDLPDSVSPSMTASKPDLHLKKLPNTKKEVPTDRITAHKECVALLKKIGLQKIELPRQPYICYEDTLKELPVGPRPFRGNIYAG